MSESAAAWVRLAIFVVIVIVVGTFAGLFAFQHFSKTDASGADSQSLAQIQDQLTSIQKRLGDLETRSKAQSARTPLNAKPQDEVAQTRVRRRALPDHNIKCRPHMLFRLNPPPGRRAPIRFQRRKSPASSKELERYNRRRSPIARPGRPPRIVSRT